MIKVLGGLILAIGIIVASLSGLCTLIFLPSAGTNDMGAVLLIGGIPFALGMGLILGGISILRRS